ASYNNIITMRDPINDNIIGFCAEESKSGSFKDKDDDISQIHVLTTKTGIMSCQLNISEIKRSLPQNKYDEMDIEDSQAKINKELKFILEQAIFLKSDNNVPVECTLSPDFRGDINQVVVDISDEILDLRKYSFYPHYLDNLNDLKVQLNERCNKMTALVQFINNSGIMDKLAFEAASNFRKGEKDLYAITTNDSKGSWTFQSELLKVLHQQFEDTDAAIKSYQLQASNKGSYLIKKSENVQQRQAPNIDKLKDQLVGLADLLFGITVQRLYSDDIMEKSHAKNYREQWTEILRKLVLHGNGMGLRALELSETYEDYKSLVVLVMESNSETDELIEVYMKKYKEKFAYMLYEWYLKQERYAELLSQPHAIEHKEWLQSFLNERNLRGISWIHDINMCEYDEASIKTRQLTLKEKRIEDVKTLLSISKLTYLAGLDSEADIQSEEVQNTIEEIAEIENGFELVIAYKEIQKQFLDIIVTSNKRLVDENEQATTVADNIINGVQKSRPTLAKLFKQYVPYILQGEKISTEELIEVMTLRECKEKDDFPFALQFTLNDETLPDDRRRALVQTIWRRIYINDRWDSISNTNDMSDDDVNERIKNTALYHTLEVISTRTDMPLYQWFSLPVNAFFASTTEQLQRRFPEFNAEQINKIIEDYKEENRALENIIQHYQLISHVEHALRLLDLKSSFDTEEDLMDPMEVVEDNT
ncbi:12461_t:CDS:10, partial [Acaulospora colombiana]